MNIKYDPNQPVHNKKVNYHRDIIYDYEEKKDRESERWKKLAKDNREKMTEGIRAKFANEPGYAQEKVNHMRATRPPDLLDNIARRKLELGRLIEECGCTAPINITWDKQDKAFAYFKKLKEARDKMKAEREKSL